MEYVTDRRRNPFGLDPDCERAVPGYGDANAHFHAVGAHPGVHGGTEAGIPFTGRPWSDRFFDALAGGGLVTSFDPGTVSLDCPGTFLSYLSMCPPDAADTTDCEPPMEAFYAEMEPYFDAELRAIAAHVLLPVGEAATEHVLETCTSLTTDRSVEGSHASVLGGAGWLVVPVLDPADWTDDHTRCLVETLTDIQSRDYRQQSDLGRFFPDEEPYLVR